MPRIPASTPDDIYDALKEFKFLNESGVLLPWGDNVWAEATRAMQGKMSRDYIYLYLSKNRNGVLDRIHGIVRTDSSIKDVTNEDTIKTDSSNWSTGETSCSLPPLRESIIIRKNEWDGLKSHIVQYKDRVCEVLVVGWADAIYDILWNHLKLPCPYSFKNAKINRNPGEIFLSIKGNRSECRSTIHIYCLNEPGDDSEATAHISTFDSRGVAHEKKRQVRGERRLRIGKELQGKSTYAWRRDEARKLMDFGDVIPANIPKEEVVRKAKQEARDKELGLFKVHSALASLWDLKYAQEFSGSIHEIGLDKFYVMYWTKTQTYLLKKFLKEDDVGSVSIDATGSLVQQIPNPDDSKRVVFLYQAVCGFHNKILPLFQMVSEKHDTNTLTYWMREWLRSAGGSIPRQVVTDYSLALLNAVSLAFNNKDLEAYVEESIVLDKTSLVVNRPQCIIRIDVAHLIKFVTRWKCFQNDILKKDFFVRCVGLLSTLTNLADVIKTCTDIVTVARATHENIEDKESLCFAASTRIIKRLRTFNISRDADENLDISNLPVNTYCDSDYSAATRRSNGIVANILNTIETDSANAENLKHGRLNPYYCPEFGSRLLKLAKHFVLWTGVMASEETSGNIPRDLVASSAKSEEYFRELKSLLFAKRKSVRVDKFVISHLRSLEGTANLLNAPISKKPSAARNTPTLSTTEVADSATDSSNVSTDILEESTESNVDVSPHCLNEVEDWRGLNKAERIPNIVKSLQGKRRGKYLTASPDIEMIHKRPKFTPRLPLLANGNLLKPVKISNKVVRVTNTCAFDSTMQSILAAVSDFDTYDEYLSGILNPPMKTFLRSLIETGVTAKLYEQRGLILSASHHIKNGTLDCMTNIVHLQEKHIFDGVPSVQRTIKCETCLHEEKKCEPVLWIDAVHIFQHGMTGLQDAVNETATLCRTNSCFRCKSPNIKKTISAGRHLIIDIEDASNALLSGRRGYPSCRQKFSVLEIPESLNYVGSKYKFVSAMIYTSGHYFAYIKRMTGKWEEHNDLKTKVTPLSSRFLHQQHSVHVLFYVRTINISENIPSAAASISPVYE